MASAPSIQQILTTSEIREYLVFNSNASNQAFKGKTIAPNWPLLIDAIRKGVQLRFSLNSNDPSLPFTSNFLFSIVAPLISISNNLLTSNLRIVAVTTTTILLQWSAVPHGVTYVLERALDSGFNSGLTQIFSGGALTFNDTGLTPNIHYYYRIHVEAPNYINSPFSFADATTLPIPVTINVSYYYGDTDYFVPLSAGTDTITYIGNFNINHNQNINVPWGAGASNNKFLVLRVPIGESIKTLWNNTQQNNGQIPDQVWRDPLHPAGLPLYTYYVTRVAQSLDPTQPYIFS